MNILNLRKSLIDNMDLESIANKSEMRSITLLDISETRITDEGIRYLAKS